MNPAPPDGDPRPAIVARIRALHADGKPLNISAVKRHSPGLVEAACAVRPYWGWQAALDAAGCPYGSFPIELLETCRCRICGVEQGILTSHLRSVHGLTTRDYLAQFPGAELMAEAIRAERTGTSDYLPDVEPVYSRESIMDRIVAYQKAGLPLFWSSVKKNDNGFSGAVLATFGSWDAALQAVGLDPGQVRRVKPGRSLSRNDVIERLKIRVRDGRSLNDAAVQRDDLSLSNAARRRFGSFNAALRAAGIDPVSVQLRPARYGETERELLLTEARRVAALNGDARAKAARAMHRNFEKIAVACFGNWRGVANAIGVGPERLFEHRFPDRASVLAALAERVRKRQSIRPVDVFREDRSLYNAINRRFGKFKDLEHHLKGLTPSDEKRDGSRRLEG